jgi:hypothetical protein
VLSEHGVLLFKIPTVLLERTGGTIDGF